MVGPLVDPSGHRVPERRLQAQRPLQTPLGLSTGARPQRGLQRISEANLKQRQQTKEKLAAQQHAAKIGRRVRGELKRIERRIVDAGLTPDGN